LPAIAGNQVIRVRFWGFLSIDGMTDRGEFFVSKDGVSWESLAQLYNNMETLPSLTPKWHKYEFSLDPSYSGQKLYLRFRAAVQSSSPSFYCGGGDDLSGFYIDDIAVTVQDYTGSRSVFSLAAREDPSTWASCPWVAPWNGTSFKADNDIYPVARFAQGEMTDFYKLMQPLAVKDGAYALQVQERDAEDSYTDFVALLQIDHAPDVSVAPDEKGRLTAYRPAFLTAPQAAATADGQNVQARLATADGSGYAAYSGDTVVVDFGSADISQGAALVLGVKGFLFGTGPDRPYVGPPAVVVETQASPGVWQERGRLLPRFEYSVAAFDLSPYLPAGQAVQVRLRSVSHSVKYNLIDYVALQAGAQPAFSAAQVAPTAASGGAASILDKLAAADGNYCAMSGGNQFSLKFPVRAQPAGSVRDFIFVSKGYYIPKGGSFLVYSWDGTDWVFRDGRTYPGSIATKDFDLSLFLPDPDGQYKVQVWQDYQYEPAAIDYVAMAVDGVGLPLEYAHDYRYNSDIWSVVSALDGSVDGWSGCPRNRVTEFHFTPTAINVPPTANPVTVSSGALPVIAWTYFDKESEPQIAYEIQVWTGPGATGVIVWNPPIFSGSNSSENYAGPALAVGTTYYARVRVQDAKGVGPWAETAFNSPAICGDFNKDGAVDMVDYVLFKGHYGKRPGQAGWIAEADYDRDNIGCLHDYNAWLACYKKYGSSPK
jgi:hypothetical protein